MDNERPPSLSVVQDKDDHAVPLPNVAKTPDKPAKKTTRQWAAWTRQEEENFFSALRQVGKNFEKITSRVQSKNKEQVRHYYYRLVRRMKKLLGPGFGLDAKNSKETIAAMLRWWSLLEKHSCTASKLHLKPRRFKTFIEALAHQLLKDRNKTRRRRPTQGEAFLPATPATGSVLGMGLGNDSHPVKLFYVDGQNIRKVGSKGTCIGANDSYSRGSLTNIKTMKQRRRSGLVASTAYKRWEKAAIDGVSLVADAAACLERSTMDENSPYDHVTSNVLPATNSNTCFPEGICCAGIAGEATSSANISGNHTQTVPYIQPLTKLKLQLFPLDDITRKALEKDEHNPYLELALSTRKKITSVIDHLNRKWGKSSIAAGELTLFPYNMHPEDVSYCPRWTQKDTYATAADIFITVGSPLIFRLRYAWLSNCDSRIIQLSASRIHLDNQIKSSDDQVQNAVNASNLEFEDADRRSEESPTMVAKSIALPSDNVDRIILTSEEPGGLSMFPQDAVSPDIQNEVDSRKEHKDYKAMSHGSRTILSAGRWADSLTNISVGELLSEASRDAFSFRNGPVDSAAQFLPKTSMSSDSFDAVIASHLQGFRNQQSTLPTDSHQSIWDAEETCDGFSFSLLRSHNADVPGNSATGSPGCAIGADSTGYPGLPENIEPTDGNQSDGDEELKDISQLNEEQTYSYSENSLGLADISWLDSSGALDLDVPPSRYVNQDMLFGDCNSLDGLNRFTANSLDAFQSCLFFSSLDRKEIGGG